MTGKAKTKAAIVELGAGMGDFAEWCTQPDSEEAMTAKSDEWGSIEDIKPEPDIYVERCIECPMHIRFDLLWFECMAIKRQKYPRVKPTDRLKPRWCPLLKAPITIAARRKG